MGLVVGCWVLAMYAGLAWRRRYAAILTGLTLGAAWWAQPSWWAAWEGWIWLIALGATPWLLAMPRLDMQRAITRFHAEEATRSSRLADTTRSLTSLEQQTQELERQIADLTDLYRVTKETSRALNLHELFRAAASIAPRLLSVRGLRLVDLSGEVPQVWRAMRSRDGRLLAQEVPVGLEVEQAILTEALEAGRAGCMNAAPLGDAVPEGVTRVCWAPLWREQQPIGLLIGDELPETQLETLSIVANQLSLQCARIHLYQQVEALAVTDGLTGIFVRGHFLERAREELERARRHRLPYTLLMTDLDHFKRQNDTFGHLVGDVVLKEVARLLQRHLREIDLIARFGGEEFILLLIETGLDHGMAIAQRLRQLVEAQAIRAYDESLTQTISMGVAAFPEHGDTLELLIERADAALYQAKREGRNRVVAWGPQVTGGG